MPTAAPTTLAEMMSESAEFQPSVLRVTHSQPIGMTNEARLTKE